MKIMDTMASEGLFQRPPRRYYSAELKTQVVQACGESGASVAGVALAHGINANSCIAGCVNKGTQHRLSKHRGSSCRSDSMNRLPPMAPTLGLAKTFESKCAGAKAPSS